MLRAFIADTLVFWGLKVMAKGPQRAKLAAFYIVWAKENRKAFERPDPNAWINDEIEFQKVKAQQQIRRDMERGFDA